MSKLNTPCGRHGRDLRFDTKMKTTGAIEVQMNLNKFSQAKSKFSHVVQMVRNHIAEMYKFHVKYQIWRHASSPCFKAVHESPKLYSIAHKSMCLDIDPNLI